MGSSTKAKVGFILLHSLFIIMAVALAIVGMLIMEVIFYIVGILFAIWGVLIFFSHTFVETGIYDSFGNEYIYTNIKSRLVCLVVMILVGGAIAVLPQFFEDAYIFAGLSITLVGMASAWRIGVEDDDETSSYWTSTATKLMGFFVPFVYIIGSGVFMLSNLFGFSGVWHVIVVGLGAVLHIVRTVFVCVEHSF